MADTEHEQMSEIKPSTEWQIAKRQLKKNRVAMFGFWILAVLYTLMVFADFIAPYDQAYADREKNFHPPVTVHFVDPHGGFHPFIYNYVENPKFSRHYEPDPTKTYPIHFFYDDPDLFPHPLLFLFPTRVHLFGVESPARLYLFGSDDSGRDVFSRILYGSRVALTIGIVGVIVSYGLGVLIGGISGFYSGKPIPLGIWWETGFGLLGLLISFPSGLKNNDLLSEIRNSVLIGVALAFLIRVLVRSSGGTVSVERGAPGQRRVAAIDIDDWIQRAGEMLMMFPSLYLLLGLRALIPENLPSSKVYFLIVVILSFIRWPAIARIVRGLVLSIRELEFVGAAQAIGCSNFRIIVRHILPNTLSQVIVLITLSIPNFILGEAFLSYLDLGIREPQASWGNMLTQAQDVVALTHYPWVLLPGLFIFVTVLGFNLLGDGLRDALDPKMRV